MGIVLERSILAMYQFTTPFTCLVSGPTLSGKTSIVIDIINKSRELIDATFQQIIWCYAEKNSIDTILARLNEEQKRKITFQHGIPDEFENKFNQPVLVVLDDLMTESAAARKVSELFTRGSHHRNLSIFLITQNLFNQEKYYRSISLNSKYIIHFKSPRDSMQFNSLARQIGNPALVPVYKELCKKSHGYIFLDLSQEVNHLLRYRSNVLDNYCTVFCDLDSDPDIKNETIGQYQTYIIHTA